jgi:hypothetical protein
VLIAAIPAVIRLGFSQYGPAIATAQLLCIVSYFHAVGIGAQYVISSHVSIRRIYILYVALIAATAYILLPIIGRRGGIAGVAAGMIVITAARTLWLSWTARRLSGATRVDAGRDVARLTLFGAAALAVPLAVQAMLATPASGPVAIVGITTVRVGAVMVLLLGLGILCVPRELRQTLSALRRALPRLGSSVPDYDNPPVLPPVT